MNSYIREQWGLMGKQHLQREKAAPSISAFFKERFGNLGQVRIKDNRRWYTVLQERSGGRLLLYAEFNRRQSSYKYVKPGEFPTITCDYHWFESHENEVVESKGR